MVCMKKRKDVGAAGFRSRYLAHAKRAICQLIYSPFMGTTKCLTAYCTDTIKLRRRRLGAVDWTASTISYHLAYRQANKTQQNETQTRWNLRYFPL
eukprot:6214719-Pleurochrysis_carterae.AAC.3